MSEPYAYLFGQAVRDLPRDLFIPPDALQVVLRSFEGPLDLLLYLIRKQNLDILDIPVSSITAQYVDYVNQMDKTDLGLDLTAEYLLMAAMLIEIKSRLLLPQDTESEEEYPEEDPRAELVRRLLAYEQMKWAAQKLDELPQAGRDFAWAHLPVDWAENHRQPEVAVADLKQAWLRILTRAQHHQNHQVIQDSVSVGDHMNWILAKITHSGGKQFFHDLFDVKQGVEYVVLTFIALLELMKEGKVRVFQETDFGIITVLMGDENP